MKDITPSEVQYTKKKLMANRYRIVPAFKRFLSDIIDGKIVLKHSFLIDASKSISFNMERHCDPYEDYDFLDVFLDFNHVDVVLGKNIVDEFSKKFFEINSHGISIEIPGRPYSTLLAQYLIDRAQSISFEYVCGKNWIMELDAAPEAKKQEPIDERFTPCGMSFSQLMGSLNNTNAPSAP